MLKLCFYVPESHLEAVKQAVFDAGAGTIGNYEHCCWQVAGQGQFKPMEGSQPFVGEHGKIETVNEFKVEMVCSEESIAKVIDCLKDAHPYETPAYDVQPLLTQYS